MRTSKRGTSLDRPAHERGDLPATAPNQDDPFWKKTAQEFNSIESARKGIDGSAPVTLLLYRKEFGTDENARKLI